MNEQLVCGRLRKEFDKVGLSVLLYYGIKIGRAHV